MEANIKNFKYFQLRESLLRLSSLQNLYNKDKEMENVDTLEETQKLCAEFSNALKGDLSLQELSSLYSTSIMLLLLGSPEVFKERLELLNECFNYSDMLKPTMIDYSTRELIDNFKFAAGLKENHKCYDYMSYLLAAIPHVITASETGKMISLGLLRVFISELTAPAETIIVMHIYRSISEIWQMLKPIRADAILDEWSLEKLYILIKSFSLILSTAGLNSNNAALKQAGYRGFELPQPETQAEICEWFKVLRNKLEEKSEQTKSKFGFMLIRRIDFNILCFLTEVGNEIASEAGNDTVLQ